MKNFTSHSLIETENLAKQWLEDISAQAMTGKIREDNEDKATIVALNGQLGSGKTTFVQFIAHQLGVKGNITSPTFVIMKKYDLRGVGDAKNSSKHTKNLTQFKNLIHIDAYRLEQGADLAALEFAEIVADPGNLVLIEWADNVKTGLPASTKKIDFEYVGENERRISF